MARAPDSHAIQQARTVRVCLAVAMTAALGTACRSPVRRAPAAAAPSGAAVDGAIAQGHALYRVNGCAVCHGPDGRGDGVSAARLHPAPRDFKDLTSYVQGTSAADIAATLGAGFRTGTPPMPTYSHLSRSDRLALGAFIVSLQRAAESGGHVVVRDAWIQEASVKADTAAYLTLENDSSEPVSLVAASVGPLATTELDAMHVDHTTMMMSMVKVEQVAVQAGGVTTLKPGGFHIMLYSLTKALSPGDTTNITLRFSDGTTKTVSAQVRSRAAVSR